MMRIWLVRFGPVAASVLAHVGVVCAIALAPAITVRTPVLFAELVEPDPLPQPPPPAVRPAPVDRRPLQLPKPVETPMPAPPTMSRREPEPTPEAPPPPAPTPAAPADASPVAAPSAAPSPVASGPTAVDVPERASGVFASAQAAPTVTGSAAPSGAVAQPTGPAVAALPTEGITQRAIPQGGYQHRPAYPSSARRLGVQGTTLLNVLVADDGRVANVVVAQSAGHPDLDQAAAEAVRRWRFEPARRGVEKVAMWVQLPVEFRLR
jgi:periplasmic protein TonB